MELTQLVEKINKEFHDFREEHTKQLDEIKAGRKDPILEEKLRKIDLELSKLDDLTKTINELQLEARRPGRGDEAEEEIAKKQHREAWNKFARKGHEAGLRELEAKAVNTLTDADGGFVVPDIVDRRIIDLAVNYSILRPLFSQQTIGAGTFAQIVNMHGAASGWVGETAARPETATPQFATVSPFMGEIYANPAVTQTALDDMFVDVESWLAREVQLEFSLQENSAFINGNGVVKPKGLLAYTFTTTDDGVRAFGTVQYVPTGVAGDWPATLPQEILLTLMDKLAVPYHTNARFLLNRFTMTAIRKMKAGDGTYLWSPGFNGDAAPTIWGYPYTIVSQLANVEANAFAVLFGDFKAAYTVFDRIGTRVLRDPFTNKPYVHFYTTKRVGGAVVNSNAFKALKFALS